MKKKSRNYHSRSANSRECQLLIIAVVPCQKICSNKTALKWVNKPWKRGKEKIRHKITSKWQERDLDRALTFRFLPNIRVKPGSLHRILLEREVDSFLFLFIILRNLVLEPGGWRYFKERLSCSSVAWGRSSIPFLEEGVGTRDL
jgi:hypothetical protein